MYEKLPYPLPVTLEIGDKLLIEGTGSIRRPNSSVAFNGFRRCGPTTSEASLRLDQSGAGAPVPPLHLTCRTAPEPRLHGVRTTCHDCFAEDPIALITDAAPFAIRAERASDVVTREALLDGCLA